MHVMSNRAAGRRRALLRPSPTFQQPKERVGGGSDGSLASFTATPLKRPGKCGGMAGHLFLFPGFSPSSFWALGALGCHHSFKIIILMPLLNSGRRDCPTMMGWNRDDGSLSPSGISLLHCGLLTSSLMTGKGQGPCLM